MANLLIEMSIDELVCEQEHCRKDTCERDWREHEENFSKNFLGPRGHFFLFVFICLLFHHFHSH